MKTKEWRNGETSWARMVVRWRRDDYDLFQRAAVLEGHTSISNYVRAHLGPLLLDLKKNLSDKSASK